MRGVLAFSFSLALLLLAAVPASAAPAETTTVIVKNVTDVFPTLHPCTGVLGTVTTVSNGVMHTTTKNGTTHATFTQAGTFTFVPLAAGPTFVGHFAIWGGFNGNNNNMSGTFTFNVTGKGSDGSRFSAHAVEHFSTSPGGPLLPNMFSKFHC
jgi:hypothetical protein